MSSIKYVQLFLNEVVLKNVKKGTAFLRKRFTGQHAVDHDGSGKAKKGAHSQLTLIGTQ